MARKYFSVFAGDVKCESGAEGEGDGRSGSSSRPAAVIPPTADATRFL